MIIIYYSKLLISYLGFSTTSGTWKSEFIFDIAQVSDDTFKNEISEPTSKNQTVLLIYYFILVTYEAQQWILSLQPHLEQNLLVLASHITANVTYMLSTYSNHAYHMVDLLSLISALQCDINISV